MEGKRSGEFVGAFSAYGYIKNPKNKHKLIIDEEAADVVKKIFDWKVNDGLGNLTICHRLNEMGILNPTGYKRKILNQNYNNAQMKENDYSWSPSTIRNILKNDIYIGNVTQGKRRVKSYKIHKMEKVPEEEWITIENMHEPIIEKEVFERAQELRNIDTRVKENGKLSIWAGMLKCADCGRAMHKKYSKNKSGKIYEYYICSTYRKKSNKLCTKHTLKIEKLEKTILEIIRLYIRQFVDIEEVLKQLEKSNSKNIENRNIENVRKKKEYEIERIKRLKKELYEDWKNEYISKEEYLEYRQKYEKDIEKLSKIIENLNRQKEEQKKNNIYKEIWIKELKINRNISELDREIITELINYIEVCENNKMIIHFKFTLKEVEFLK